MARSWKVWQCKTSTRMRESVPDGTTVVDQGVIPVGYRVKVYDDNTKTYAGNVWIYFNFVNSSGTINKTGWCATTNGSSTYWTAISSGTDYATYTVKTYFYNGSNYYLYESKSVQEGSTYTFPSYTGSKPSNENVTFNITFRKNDGTSTSEKKSVYYTRKYSFCGWTVQSSSSAPDATDTSETATSASSITVNGNKYIYASFEYSRTNATNTISTTTNYPGFVNTTSTNTYTATFYEDNISTKTLSRTVVKGKAFKGWSTSSTGSVISSSTVTYTGAKTLYAVWDASESIIDDTGAVSLPGPTNSKSSDSNIYTVSFSNSTGNDNISSKYAGTRSYTFGGWYNSAGTTNYGSEGTSYTIQSNISMYAKWNPSASSGTITLPTPTKSNVSGSTYQVTIDPDNGESVTTLSVPVGKKTYTFAGWYKDSSLSTFAGNAGSTYTVSSTQTLYAKWNETITNGTNISNPNDKGDLVEDVTTIIDFCAESLENYTLTSSRTTSYTFAGWYNGTTKVTSLTPYIPTADVTLKAKWNSSTEYTRVSIPTDKVRREYEEMKVILHNNYGEDLTDIYTEEKTILYSFLGIFTAQSGGSNVDSSKTGYYTPSAISTTLYAHWEVDSSYVDSITLYDASRDRIDGKEYLVYYNGNGGDPERGSDVIVRGRTEYTFVGWFDSPTGGNKITSPYKPVQSSIDFYAHWTETNTNEQVQLPSATRESSEGTNVTVTLDPDKGLVLGNISAKISVSVGGKRYTFKGWYDKASSGTQIGFTGDNYYPSDLDDSIINLYANWDEDIDDGSMDLPIPTKQPIKEYTVTLDAGEGLIGTVNKKLLTARQGTLYKFNGWYDGATKIESPYSPTNDITLKAGWLIDSNVNEPITFETPVFNTSKSININLYENKSSNDTTKTVKAATKVTKKDFKGWYLDNERLDSSSNTYMPSRDGITITARWDNAKCDPITIDDMSRATETKNYTINLNSNGGTIDTGVSSLSASRSTKYDFTGWYEARGGNNTMTDSNKQYTPDPDSTTTEINMYAHWKATPSTVRAELPSATMVGYAHLGWSTDQTKQNLVTSPYVPTSNDVEAVTLYAIYSYKGKIKIKGKYYMPIVYLGGKWYKLLPEVFKNGAYRESGYRE